MSAPYPKPLAVLLAPGLGRLRGALALLGLALALAAPARAQARLDELLDLVRENKDRTPAQVFTRIAGFADEASFDALRTAVKELREEQALNVAYGAYARYAGELRSAAIEFLFSESRRHRRDENRRAAARALGRFGAEARDELMTLVEKGKDADIQAIAAQPLVPLLGAEGTPEAVEIILAYADVEGAGARAAVEAALTRCAGEANDRLLAERLGDRRTSEAWRRLLLELLAARTGPIADEALRDALEDSADLVRTRAIELLGTRGDPTVLGALRKHLRTKDPAELREVIVAIGRLSGGDEDWADELLDLSRDDEVAARLGAAVALVELRSEEAVRRLHELLEDEDWRVRVEAVQQVGNLRRRASVPTLIGRLEHEHGRVARDISSVLRLMTGQDHGLTATRWQAWWSSEGSTFRLPAYEVALAAERERAKRRRENVTVATFYGLEVVSDRASFVLDTSGSMAAPAGGAGGRTRAGGGGSVGPTRLDVAKQELEKALRGLSPGTLFNLVFFDTAVDPWRDELVEHEERSLAAAVEFSFAQRASGGTNIHDALLLAFEDERVDTLYLLSDGDPTAGKVTDPERILDRIGQLNRTRKLEINTISIGQASKFLRRLAEENGGVYVERL